MAIGVYSDFKLYDEQFQAGQYEVIAQNLDGFNAASANAIRMVARELLGHYNKEAFFKHISNLITRRDISSVSAATDLPMTQDEFIGVKVNRKIGPVAQTLDAMRKIGMSDQEISFILGQIVASARLADMLNTSILAVEAAIEGQTALNYDATGETVKTLTHEHLVSGLSKLGDQASKVVCWVMHSKPYFDLMKQSIADKITNIADATIYAGTVATLGRPTVVVDAPALHDDNGSLADTYNVLGLVVDAVTAIESEDGGLTSQVVTGLENLVVRFQGEYAFNLMIKGFKWDTANGGENPTDTALGTTTNWDKVATSDKDLAGVRIVVQ